MSNILDLTKCVICKKDYDCDQKCKDQSHSNILVYIKSNTIWFNSKYYEISYIVGEKTYSLYNIRQKRYAIEVWHGVDHILNEFKNHS